MIAKEYLNQISKLNRMIENKTIEREQWQSKAYDITSKWGGEKVQSSGSPDKIQKAIAHYIDLEKEIDDCIASMIEKTKEIIGVIEQLKTDEYDLLHKIYVQGMTFKECAFACNKSESWVSTIHGVALKNVQIILDEREKETWTPIHPKSPRSK